MEYKSINNIAVNQIPCPDEQMIVREELNDLYHKYLMAHLLRLYTPKKTEKILNLGCGTGRLCFSLAPLCEEAVGLDSDLNNIAKCNALLERNSLPNVKFIPADAQCTQLKSGSYDVIICTHLFDHLSPGGFSRILGECRRLLKKGGKLLLLTPHRGYITEILKNNNGGVNGNGIHEDYKSMDSMLSALGKRYFMICKSYYTESHIPIVRNLEKPFLRFLPVVRRRIAILAERLD